MHSLDTQEVLCPSTDSIFYQFNTNTMTQLVSLKGYFPKHFTGNGHHVPGVLPCNLLPYNLWATVHCTSDQNLVLQTLLATTFQQQHLLEKCIQRCQL